MCSNCPSDKRKAEPAWILYSTTLTRLILWITLIISHTIDFVG